MTAGPAGGLLCGVLWLVCPKCPACVAGYAALFGWVSLSISAVAPLLSGVREALFCAMAAGVVILGWRIGRGLVR